MQKMIALAMMCLLVLLFAPSAVRAADFDKCLFEHNRPAVVFITYKWGPAEGDKTQGTGFVITPTGYILTARHVLEPDKNVVPPAYNASASVIFGANVGPEISASIAYRDKDHDIALLKIDLGTGVTFAHVAIGGSEGMGVGSPIIGVGFPKSNLSITNLAEITSDSATVEGDTSVWQTGLALNDGNSGGPIFNTLGTVVGIADATRDDNAQLISYVVPMKSATAALAQAGVQTVPYADCAEFPICRDPAHGVESYAIDAVLKGESDRMGGGHTRGEFCNQYLASLQRQYPNSAFTKVDDGEQSSKDILGHVTYVYECRYERQEQPTFKAAAGPECLPPTPGQ